MLLGGKGHGRDRGIEMAVVRADVRDGSAGRAGFICTAADVRDIVQSLGVGDSVRGAESDFGKKTDQIRKRFSGAEYYYETDFGIQISAQTGDSLHARSASGIFDFRDGGGL